MYSTIRLTSAIVHLIRLFIFARGICLDGLLDRLNGAAQKVRVAHLVRFCWASRRSTSDLMGRGSRLCLRGACGNTGGTNGGGESERGRRATVAGGRWRMYDGLGRFPEIIAICEEDEDAQLSTCAGSAAIEEGSKVSCRC